jgi:putative flippase GtrA
MMRGLLDEASSMLRFAVVGIGASSTYILVALLAGTSGLQPQGANLIGVLASTGVSFFGHAYYSFRRGGLTARYLMRFTILSLAVYVLSRAATHAGVEWLAWSYLTVVFAVAALIPLVTWTASRFWVFR